MMTFIDLLSSLMYKKESTLPTSHKSNSYNFRALINLIIRDQDVVPHSKNIHTQNILPRNNGVFTYNNVFIFFILSATWLIINLFQSLFTQIANDEAYYWLYSKHLDWGYFDHPPMIALFIWLGSFFFDGELGVRCIAIVAQLVSIFIIWNIIAESKVTVHKVILFFIIAASIPLFQIYGFISTPDAPLLFFTALFLYAFKNFISTKSLFNISLLAITMTCLVYSKYHGLLVILFALLPNLKIIFTKYFLLATTIALIFFLPHIIWQFENNFPTLQFQMAERVKSFRLKHFIEYWPYQLISFNPTVLFLLTTIFFRSKFETLFERSLASITIGFFLFFWFTSLWIRPEPHWTAAASIPAIILLYNNVVNHSGRIQYVYRFILPSFLLIAFARLIIIFNILPVKLEFHGQKEWAHEVKSKAGDLPVAFVNSYQKASVYSFYTNSPAFSLNNIYYRRNQFDLWAFEQVYQNKEVAALIPPHPRTVLPKNIIPLEKDFMVTQNLISTQRISIHYDPKEINTLKSGQQVTLPVSLTNQTSTSLTFIDSKEPVSISLVFSNRKKWFATDAITSPPLDSIKANATIQTTLHFTVPPLASGYYKYGISLRTPMFLEGFNSSFAEVFISEN